MLGTGRAQGYEYDVRASSSPAFRPFVWFAVVKPIVPTQTGDRYFYTNQTGVIFFANSAQSVTVNNVLGEFTGVTPIGQ